MKKLNSVGQKAIVLMVGLGFMLGAPLSQANMKVIKAYKEAFPEAKTKCINCHEQEKPKKDEGQHEYNNYGKAAMKINPHPTAETFKKLGTFDDFKKSIKPLAEKK